MIQSTNGMLRTVEQLRNMAKEYTAMADKLDAMFNIKAKPKTRKPKPGSENSMKGNPTPKKSRAKPVDPNDVRIPEGLNKNSTYLDVATALILSTGGPVSTMMVRAVVTKLRKKDPGAGSVFSTLNNYKGKHIQRTDDGLWVLPSTE